MSLKKAIFFYTPLSSRTKAVILFLTIFVLFLVPVKFLGSGDGVPARLLPLSIIGEGDFDLDEMVDNIPVISEAYFVRHINGHYVSMYPVLPAILALPVYMISILAGFPVTNPVVLCLARISAAIITTLAAVFMYFIFKRFISKKWSSALTIAYALGTSNWAVSSQDLWQHGTNQLFLILTVFALLKVKENEWFYFLAGLFSGLAVAARPVSVVIVFFIFLYILQSRRKYLLQTVLGILVPLTLLAFYNTYYFGVPWMTGYGQSILALTNWETPLVYGLLGQLVSPSRGLLVFSPFLIFSLAGIVFIWRKKSSLSQDQRLLFRYLFFGLVFYILVMSKWAYWYGGYSYGCRMLLDIVPLLMIFIIPVVKRRALKKKWLAVIFLFLISISIFFQLVGVLFMDGSWYNNYHQGPREDQSWLWDWKNSQLFYYMSKFKEFSI